MTKGCIVIHKYSRKKYSRFSAWKLLRLVTGLGGLGNNPFRKCHTGTHWCWEQEDGVTKAL